MVFKEAKYYRKLQDKKVACKLCPKNCVIGNGEDGFCKVRRNVNGKLKSMNYGNPFISTFKKVEDFAYHFLPGTEIFCVACVGNNLFGDFAENFGDIEETPTIEQTASQVAKYKNIVFIGEPTVYYEYVSDVLTKKTRGIVVTNGYIEREAINELANKADFFVFNIKSMMGDFYEKFLGVELDSILKSIKAVYDSGKNLEIKMKIIPEIHKDFYDVRKVVSWILNNLDADVPLHFVKFRGEDISEEDIEILKRARKIAVDAGMNFVYINGINDLDSRTTFCPNCKKPVIIRDKEILNNLNEGVCKCGKQLSGVWQ